MKLRTHGLTAIATALLAAGSFAQTSFPEVEPNSLKAEATAVTGIVAGDSINGTSTGTTTTAASTLVTTADVFRVKTGALPLGIYRHTLTITSTTVGHTGTIRGLNQTGVTGTASTGGTVGTVDSAVQTSSTTSVNPPPRSNVWYGFGKQEELYYRVTGTTATTNAYDATMATAAVTFTVLPQPFESANPITITTIGEATADTEVKVYDAAFNSIAGFDNDDEGPAGPSLQTRLIRTFAPGTYYIAMGRSNTAWNHPSPADEDFLSLLTDFPDVVVCASSTPLTTGTDDRDFQIVASNGLWNEANIVAAPNSFSIQWFCFTVAAGAPPIVNPPPANDNCASAIALPAAGATTAGTMLGATNDGAATCDAGGAASRDVWYSWTNTAASARLFSASTCTTTGLNDTVVSIYASCGGAELGCNDDNAACVAQPLTSLVSGILVNAAQTIIVRVSDKGLGGTTQNFNVITTVTAPPPSNDSCATPTAVVAGSTAVDTTGATTGVEGQTEAICLFSGTSNIRKDVWYTYAATSNGTATITTCGLLTGSPSQDSKISIFSGTACPAAGTAIACKDDDLVANCAASGLNTTLSWPTVCGTTYLIQFGGFSTTAAIIGTFNLSEVVTTSCNTPFTVFCDGSLPGTCLGCGNNGLAGKGCGNSVFAGGTQLVSSGIATVGSDTLLLTTTDQTGPGLFIQANALIGVTFGDGMLCAGVGIIRLGLGFPTASSATYPNVVSPTLISVAGLVNPGDTKHYQCWYRDTGESSPGVSFCTPSTFNLSNGVTLTWN